MKKIIFFVVINMTLLSFAQTVPNIASLTTYIGGNSVYVEGYYNKGDGGGGHFYKIPSSETVNNGTVFIDSTNTDLKWMRIIDDGKVNVKWFGAKGDGSTDDHTEIYDAKQYALSNNLKLYFPSGIYNFNDNFIDFDQKIDVYGDGITTILKGSGSGGSIVKISGSNVNISKISIQSISGQTAGITISNDAFGITLNEINFSNKLDEAIRLYNCSDIKIQNCVFDSINGENSGYSIMQYNGYSSNNVSVIGNYSINCKNDFVELNSERSNYSKNWLISNNTVKDIGKDNDRNVGSAESRFVGVTNTDGIIISNNIFENCFGDSAFHFENLTGNVVIAANTIKNPTTNSTGQAGSVIMNVNLEECKSKDRTIIFENNIVEFDTKYSGGTKLLFFTDGKSGSNTTMQILNNKFTNNSKNEIDVIRKDLINGKMWNIRSNEFYGFNEVIKIGPNSSYTNIIDNSFFNCNTGIIIDKRSDYNNTIKIEGNLFKNIVRVLESEWDAKVNLLSFKDNVIDNSNLEFKLKSDFLNGFKGNIFLNHSTTNYNDKSIKTEVQQEIPNLIFQINSPEYTFLCWVEIESGVANRTRNLLRVSRNFVEDTTYNNYVQILDQVRNGNYPLPSFYVDENGLNAIINGPGTASGPYKVKVNIIDINGFLNETEQSLGYSINQNIYAAKNTANIKETATNFENTVSYEDFINASPNPVKDILKLDSNNAIDNIKIFDLNGKLVKDITDAKNIKEINLSSLTTGVYIGIFETSNSKVVKKIIKE